METPSLFLSTYVGWVESPHDAFADWLANKDMKDTTKHVYLWMWGKFCRWMADRSLRLDYVDSVHLDAFLVETGQTKAHTYHYLRLIERVFLYINGLADCPPGRSNPASFSIKTRPTKSLNDPTSFLSVPARARVASFVETGETDESDEKAKPVNSDEPVPSGKNGKPGDRLTDLTQQVRMETESAKAGAKPARLTGAAGEWKRQRDLALAGVFAGGGLRVQEAVTLTLSCISNDGRSLTVTHTTASPTGSSDFSRTIPLEPFAVTALQRWLAIRNQKTYGDAVFPSNTKGKAMDPSSMFRRIRLIFDELALEETDARSCCQTLRNSYIATLFDRRMDHLDIATIAGFAEVVTVIRVERSYLEFFDRLAGVSLDDDEPWQ